MSRVICPCLALTMVIAIQAGEPMAPKPAPRDEQDLVFLQASRPLRIRLHLQVGGRSFQAHWDEIMVQLFRFLDHDGNGVLSDKELEHAPSVVQLRQLIQGETELEADAAPKIGDLTDHPKAGVTLEQLKGYYHRVGVAPWQVDWVGRLGGFEPLDDILAKRLHPKNPDQLPLDSLKSAVQLIDKLDTDGDEMITVGELTPSGYVGGFPSAKPFQVKAGPFFLLDPSDKGRSLLTEELLKRYDRNKDGRLSRDELAIDPAEFAALDRNGDGLLDAPELAAWPRRPADLEILIRLDAPATESLFLLPDDKAQPRPMARSTRLTRIGAARVELADEIVEVVRADGLQARQQRLELQGLARFSELDRNKDDVLDSQEIYQPPFALVAVLRLADGNGDGKISKAEFLEFLKLRQMMVTRCVVLTLVDRGRCLFDFLDADHDHRLSRRELMTAGERLAPWMDAKQKVLDRRKVPQQYQIVVSQGLLPRINSDPGAVSAARPESRLKGPLWFRKMDRNADGDVSPAEFLGTKEQFRKLDRNGDGLIDASEAEAAGESVPKK